MSNRGMVIALLGVVAILLAIITGVLLFTNSSTTSHTLKSAITTSTPEPNKVEINMKEVFIGYRSAYIPLLLKGDSEDPEVRRATIATLDAFQREKNCHLLSWSYDKNIDPANPMILGLCITYQDTAPID